MEDDRDYFDGDGNQVSLDKLCKIEPEWSANRIRWLQAESDRKDAILSDIFHHMERWKQRL